MTEKNETNMLRRELDISTQLGNLEEKVATLENEFSSILVGARELAGVVKKFVDKVETERQSWVLLDALLDAGCSSRDVIDHVKIFFNFLLAKMESYHASVTDVKMLWHMHDTEGTRDVYRRALRSFGFQAADEKHIQLLLAIVYKLQVDLERETDTATFKPEDGVANLSKNLEDCMKSLQLKKSESAREQTGEVKTADILKTDFTEIAYNDLDKKLADTLVAWQVDSCMRDIVKKVMKIVIYALNVGRPDKQLTIVSYAE